MAPVPGTIFDSFVASKGSFLTLSTFELYAIFFFKFNSASFILYSPTPGFPSSEFPNLGKIYYFQFY